MGRKASADKVFLSLVNDVRHCQHCAEHLPLPPRPVFQLNRAARILVAAQAPGLRVHETGLPFNDPSGDRLRNWMGVDRETFYDSRHIAILPMGLCYPGRGASGDLPPRVECAPKWRGVLLKQLPNIRLTLVIGQYAQAWHLPEEWSVTQYVQHWQHYLPDRLPLPHPSPRNQIWLRRNPWFEADVVPVLRNRVQEVLNEN